MELAAIFQPFSPQQRHRALYVKYMRPDVSWSSLQVKIFTVVIGSDYKLFRLELFSYLNGIQCSFAGLLIDSKALELTKSVSQW